MPQNRINLWEPLAQCTPGWWDVVFPMHRSALLLERVRVASGRVVQRIRLANNHDGPRPRIAASWVAPSSLRAFVLDDPVLDVMRRMGAPTEESSQFMQLALGRGARFEAEVIHRLKSLFRVLDVQPSQEHAAPAAIQDWRYAHVTKMAMRKGYDVIVHGVLHDTDAKLCGCPDLLVRCDVLQRMVSSPPQARTYVAPGIEQLGYYVVDIKSVQLRLKADGCTLRCEPPTKFAAVQVAFYNKLLAATQGADPGLAFLLGGSSIDCRGVREPPYSRLACVRPEEYERVIEDGIDWVRHLRRGGKPNRMTPCDAASGMPYPNMTNQYDSPHHAAKKALAQQVSEITSVIHCGVAHRAAALDMGVASWRDPRFCSDIAGIKGRYARELDAVLAANRDDGAGVVFNPPRNVPVDAIFIDFEGISSALSGHGDVIFMVGIGQADPAWRYEVMVLDELTEQPRFMRDVASRIDALLAERPRPLVHWSSYEKTMVRRAGVDDSRWQWFDLMQAMRDAGCGVKGALCYKLKDVARAMHAQGLIASVWPAGVVDGCDAMVQAHAEYSKPRADRRWEAVVAYNEIDCRVMHEISGAFANVQ